MVDEVRIGVFVCHCGSNISRIVNIPELVKYIKTLNNVVIVDDGKWSCSSDYLEKMSNLIKFHSVNRVVIASCSPRTHESLFKQAVKKSGLNQHLLEFVSIREQVSWVHIENPIKATLKAKDLISMGVAKAFFLEKGYEIKIPVGQNSLIIGSGIAGISAALSISDQGFKVFLVEKELEIGGLLRSVKFMVNDNKKIETKNIIQSLLKKLNNRKIFIYSNTQIESLSGYIGNYKVKLKIGLSKFEKLNIDTIIVATGIEETHPIEFYTLKKIKIYSQLELEKMFIKKNFISKKKIGIINCVNSKNKIRGCCNIGCHISIKNAIELKKINNKNDIVIMYRDLSLYNQNGHLYYKAKKLGITFVRFQSRNYPKIISSSNKIIVKVFDILLSSSLKFEFDLIISTSSFNGSSHSNKIKNFLKVSVDNGLFFQEAHVKLNPLEFSSKGVGLCGTAKYPMFFEESLTEGIGAAIKVSIPMKKGYIKAEGIVASIDLSQCKKCGLCVKSCPYNAILFSRNGFPKILKALCQGCGLCSADCISKSITVLNYSDNQIFSQIEKALETTPNKKIIGFICHWCALGGVDMAGVGRLQYKTNVLLIRVMCSARVSYDMLKKCFSLRAAGTLVVGCEFPTCHYIVGNYAAKKRINKAKKKLKKLKYDPKKLWIDWCSAADGPKFASIINKMATFLNLKD